MEQEQSIAELEAAQRAKIKALKKRHHALVSMLQDSLSTAEANLERAQEEYDWITMIYNDQMHFLEEQQSRIEYLENQLRESRSLSRPRRVSLSAPSLLSSQANFPHHAAGERDTTSQP